MRYTSQLLLLCAFLSFAGHARPSETFEKSSQTAALLSHEECDSLVKEKNLERNAAGIGRLSDGVVQRFYRRFCNDTARMFLISLIPQYRTSLRQILSDAQTLADDESRRRYISTNFPGLALTSQERLAQTLKAAQSLDEAPSQSAALIPKNSAVAR